MSFVLYAYLLEKYGPRLSCKQLAEVLQEGEKGLANRWCRPDYPIRTYLDAGQRWADLRDVVEYLDRRRQEANAQTPA